MNINVSSEELSTLEKAISEAGQNYKNCYARLTNLIEEITRGDIQGDPATDLLNKYNEKEATLTGIKNTIDEAEEYMSLQNAKFKSLIDDLHSTMR